MLAPYSAFTPSCLFSDHPSLLWWRLTLLPDAVRTMGEEELTYWFVKKLSQEIEYLSSLGFPSLSLTGPCQRSQCTFGKDFFELGMWATSDSKLGDSDEIWMCQLIKPSIIYHCEYTEKEQKNKRIRIRIEGRRMLKGKKKIKFYVQMCYPLKRVA